MDKWLDLIERATTESELNKIVEWAASDDSISNSEYCFIYSTAVEKVRE